MSDVRVRFDADTKGISSGIDRIKNLVGGLGKTLGLVMAPLAALGGAAALGAGIKDILGYGGKVSDLANRTGLLASQIVVLEEAFRQAGIEGADVATTLQKLSKNVYNGGGVEWLEKWGLNAAEVKALGMADLFTLISSKIGGLAGDTEKAAAASDFFGAKQGLLLVNLFKTSTAMADAKAMTGQLGESMDKWGSGMDYVGDILEGLFIKARQFFASLVGNNLGDLTKVADYIRDLDLTNLGANAGKLIAGISNAFKNGTFWSTIWNGLLFVLQKAGEYILAVSAKAGEIIGQAIQDILPERFKSKEPPSASSWAFLKYKYEGTLGSNETWAKLMENTKGTPEAAPEAVVAPVKAFAALAREIPNFSKSIKKIKEVTSGPTEFRTNYWEYSKPMLSSLARIGGAKAMTKDPLVSLQREGNRYLKLIERNTSKARTPSWQ